MQLSRSWLLWALEVGRPKRVALVRVVEERCAGVRIVACPAGDVRVLRRC